jgi:hypothetical protein
MLQQYLHSEINRLKVFMFNNTLFVLIEGDGNIGELGKLYVKGRLPFLK